MKSTAHVHTFSQLYSFFLEATVSVRSLQFPIASVKNYSNIKCDVLGKNVEIYFVASVNK